MTVTRTLVAWCPDWPVVVTGSPPDVAVAVLTAGRVVACSAAARAEGVARGQRRRQAEVACPQLVVVDDDLGGQARVFEPVVAALEEFTPAVEVVRPGMCAFPTRGPSRYFGGDQALADRVAERVTDIVGDRVDCGVGVADGRLAAELAARARERRVVVPPGESAAYLAPFPVAVLDRPELADLLWRLGVRTLGGLAALPSAAVLARFGADGEVAHRLARGLDERPLAARRPPPELAVTVELDPPAERVDTAAFAARGLARQLYDRLSALGLVVTRVRVEAETEHGEDLARLWSLDADASTVAALADRVRWQLDGWLVSASGPTGGLTLLRLVPDEVAPDHGRQLRFWGGDRAADDRAGRSLARVQGRLGPEAVTTAFVGGGRSPREQVRLVPWGDPRPATPGRTGDVGTRSGMSERHQNARGAPWPGRVPAPSPATVYPEALPAQVIDAAGVPVVVNGRGRPSAPPARLSIAGGRWADVVAWAGPWPYDERWWDPPAHRRGARWQAVTASGAAHLLVLELDTWRVEATYD